MGKGLDLVGQKFGRLTVIEYLYSDNGNARKGRMWRCRCECGGEQVASSYQLRHGVIVSCGCKQRENWGKAAGANRTHGMSKTRLYKCWAAMKKRCKHDPNWAGKGIKVCAEWENDPQAFMDWAMANGYDDSLTLDRIDVWGNYEPSNCRWADRRTQMNNTTTNVYITIGGVTKTATEWERESGVSASTIIHRYERGYSGEDLLKPAYAVYTPDQRSAAMTKKPLTINGETHSVYEWAQITGLQPTTIRRRLYAGWPPELLIAPHFKARRGHAVLKEYQLTTPQERM